MTDEEIDEICKRSIPDYELAAVGAACADLVYSSFESHYAFYKDLFRGEIACHHKYILASRYAQEKHADQKRKYTGEPYFNHCKHVASILAKAGMDWDVIAAGVMHDTVEDTDATNDEIKELFGERVAKLVEEVTDVSRPEDGNRSIRKEMDRQHLSKASYEGKSIKLADIISNTTSIMTHDPNFSVVYLKEKEKLLEVLKGGNEDLYRQAMEVGRKHEN